MSRGLGDVYKRQGIISLGGDHTIAVPLLRAINKKCNGPVSLVHFDAHLDTWAVSYTHLTLPTIA